MPKIKVDDERIEFISDEDAEIYENLQALKQLKREKYMRNSKAAHSRIVSIKDEEELDSMISRHIQTIKEFKQLTYEYEDSLILLQKIKVSGILVKK